MQAASSPSKCTCGFSIVVLTALQFFPSTGKRTLSWEARKKIVNVLLVVTIIEIELVEIHSFHQITHRFRFKCRQMRITYFPAKYKGSFFIFSCESGLLAFTFKWASPWRRGMFHFRILRIPLREKCTVLRTCMLQSRPC